MAKKQTAYRIDEDVKKELPKLAVKWDRSQNWIVNYFLKFCIGEAKKNKDFKNRL